MLKENMHINMLMYHMASMLSNFGKRTITQYFTLIDRKLEFRLLLY